MLRRGGPGADFVNFNLAKVQWNMEKEMATHSRILAWRILWAEEPSGLYTLWGHKESDMTE